MINRLCNKGYLTIAAILAPIDTINNVKQYCFHSFDHPSNPSLCHLAADSHSFYWIATAASSVISLAVLCPILKSTWSSLLNEPSVRNEQPIRPLPQTFFARIRSVRRAPVYGKAAAAA